MVKIYKQPFAHGGDTIAIPDASQPDGKMSSADGWTPDYQLPKTDPNYKPVGRQEMNGVFKEVTEALGQVQVQGSATWSADGAPYPIRAQVYHNGKQWLARRANSVEPAEGEDWTELVGKHYIDTKVNSLGLNQWISRAIGEEIWLDDSKPAVQVPPTDNPNFRYIKLSAGENGNGGYNQGVLTNESVSGSAPLINATAEVNLPGSPFHGQTVRLLNTERRFVRAGEAGVVQDDAFQGHSHESDVVTRVTEALSSLAGGAFAGYLSVPFDAGTKNRGYGTPRIANENRPRNIGRSVYMRIL